MDSATSTDEITQNRYARRCHLRKLIRIDVSPIYPHRIPKNALPGKASLSISLPPKKDSLNSFGRH